jgi:uncharacterized protein (DUF305 family)
MEKQSQLIIIGLLLLIVGFGGGYLVRGTQVQMPGADSHMMSGGMMMGNTAMGMSGMMDGMMQGLMGKTGDEFDRAFIEEMIVHHQGAVMMAQAALANAKHEEIKQLARDIITAQTREIEMMQGWHTGWYGN